MINFLWDLTKIWTIWLTIIWSKQSWSNKSLKIELKVSPNYYLEKHRHYIWNISNKRNEEILKQIWRNNTTEAWFFYLPWKASGIMYMSICNSLKHILRRKLPIRSLFVSYKFDSYTPCSSVNFSYALALKDICETVVDSADGLFFMSWNKAVSQINHLDVLIKCSVKRHKYYVYNYFFFLLLHREIV